MKMIGVVPARYASTRFPGKPLAKILDKEMIAWVLEGVRETQIFDQVLLATDDERIASVGKRIGVQVAMTSSSLQSGSDRIWAAIENIDCDIVVNIQGDEPLVQKEWIEKLIEPFFLSNVHSNVSEKSYRSGGQDKIDNLKGPSIGSSAKELSEVQMTTLSTKINLEEMTQPNVVKVITDQNKHGIYFSRFPIPYSRQELNAQTLGLAQKHVGMYGYRKSFLKLFCETAPSSLELAESLEQLRAVSLGAKIAVREIESTSLGVDTPEDLLRVEELLKLKLRIKC